MLRIFRKLVPSILILCFFTSYAAFAQNDSSTILEAYGLNTIAGHTTYLRTSQTLVDASVVFEITDPLGDTTTLSAVSNSSGVAQAELSDYYTKHAGTYTVSARLENDFSVNNLNSFVVYPNAVSSAESVVTPGEQVVRSYGDEALVTVKLADDYGNVIEGHLVKLISSSNDDFIQLASDSNLTDANGEIVFDVSSDSPGIVTYTIYDVTADEILDSRAKVVYFDSTDYLFSSDLPNDFDYAALGNSSSGVDTFEFVDTPDSIDVGESVTFTLSANDSLDQVVTGYDGTVRFSVLSDNSLYVSLPDDFTFSTQDLGSHTFSLALSFQQEGTYSIEARDTENPAIYGEYEFVVGVGNGDSTGGLNITNPAAGTYSNNIQVVSGSAPAGSQLKIFDNDLEISTIIADASGVFSYTTTALTDGEHNLYVATINGVGTITGVSPTVTLTIDSSGPELSQVVLEPSGAVDPGTIVSVKLYTTDDLSQAAILFQDNIYEMAKGSGDFYEGSFAAPVEFGDYSVSFILIDQLGNEAKLEDQATKLYSCIYELSSRDLNKRLIDSGYKIEPEISPNQNGFYLFGMAHKKWGILYDKLAYPRIQPGELDYKCKQIINIINERKNGNFKNKLVKNGFRLISTSYTLPPKPLHSDSDCPLSTYKESYPALICWDQASQYIGQRVTVVGRVTRTFKNDKVCFLNFHNNFTKYMSIVLFASKFRYFPKNPEKYYLNKTIHVIGKIKEYKGKPEIILNKVDQIKIID